jgi:predicted dehydrogenase
VSEIRAGVVGVGSMGSQHARVYGELQGVELVGVHDRDTARASEVAAKHGTRAISMSALVDAADVVSVAVPTTAHAAVARRCLEAGVHVLVEKPFVTDLAEGEALVDLAARTDCRLQVGHIERFNPAVERLRDVLDESEVVAFEARRLGPPPGDRQLDNVVRDLMIHDIDVVLSLFGPATAVSAMTAPGAAYTTAQLRLDSGVVGTLTASRTTAQKIRTFEVTTRDSYVVVDYTDQSVRIHRRSFPEYVERDGEVRYRHEGVVEQPLVHRAEPLKRELESFVDAVRTGSDPAVTGEDGLRALRLAARFEELAGLNPQPVAVEAGEVAER